MMIWLAENIASIVLLLVLGVILFFVVRGKMRERKQGGCGCGCEHCCGCAAHEKEGGKL